MIEMYQLLAVIVIRANIEVDWVWILHVPGVGMHIWEDSFTNDQLDTRTDRIHYYFYRLNGMKLVLFLND